MKKAVALSLLAFYFSSFAIVPAFGGGGMSGGATEPTQLSIKAEEVAIHLKQIEETVAQIDQLRIEMLDIVKLPGSVMTSIGGIMDMVNSVVESYNDIQGTLNKLANIDEAYFKEVFSAVGGKDFDAVRGMFTGEGREKWADFPTELWKVSERLEDARKKAMETLGEDAENLKTRSELNETIIQKAADAYGRDQIADAANQINGAMLTELQAANKIAIDMYAHYEHMAAEERAVKDAARAVVQDDIAKMTPAPRTEVKLGWGYNAD